MEWKRLKVDGPPPCDGETVFVGINVAGFCGCFNQHGMMSLLHGPMSICFYDTAEGSHEVMTCLDFWAALDVPNAQVVATDEMLCGTRHTHGCPDDVDLDAHTEDLWSQPCHAGPTGNGSHQQGGEELPDCPDCAGTGIGRLGGWTCCACPTGQARDKKLDT